MLLRVGNSWCVTDDGVMDICVMPLCRCCAVAAPTCHTTGTWCCGLSTKAVLITVVSDCSLTLQAMAFSAPLLMRDTEMGQTKQLERGFFHQCWPTVGSQQGPGLSY